MRKIYSLAKFSNFVYFCIACGNCYTTFGQKMVAISARIQKYTKFANFAGLYFPHFTTFRNQTLRNFTHFSTFSLRNFTLSSCGDLFASPCLVLKLVYSENCLLTLLIEFPNLWYNRPHLGLGCFLDYHLIYHLHAVNCAYKCARPQFHATLKICFFTAYCTN
jgi:hypothetical protein